MGGIFAGVLLQHTTKRLRANFNEPFKTPIHEVLEAVNAENARLEQNPTRIPTMWERTITHVSLRILVETEALYREMVRMAHSHSLPPI